MQGKKISPMAVGINDNFMFPEQIKTTVGTLRHPKQWRILELLIANNDKLSYTELKSILVNDGESNGDFNYHLNELEKSGWIDNTSQINADVDDKYSSHYHITQFGSKILDGIMSSLEHSSYSHQS